MKIYSFLLITLIFILQGCQWNSFGKPVASIEDCDAYEQVRREVEVDLGDSKTLNLEGKITNKQLIQVDQEAGILSSEIKDLCNHFINERITFEQYQDGKNKAYERYSEFKKTIFK